MTLGGTAAVAPVHMACLRPRRMGSHHEAPDRGVAEAPAGATPWGGGTGAETEMPGPPGCGAGGPGSAPQAIGNPPQSRVTSKTLDPAVRPVPAAALRGLFHGTHGTPSFEGLPLCILSKHAQTHLHTLLSTLEIHRSHTKVFVSLSSTELHRATTDVASCNILFFLYLTAAFNQVHTGNPLFKILDLPLV